MSSQKQETGCMVGLFFQLREGGVLIYPSQARFTGLTVKELTQPQHVAATSHQP
jgi:hypothetical protein